VKQICSRSHWKARNIPAEDRVFAGYCDAQQGASHTFAFSRRETPEACINIRPDKGAGNAGRPMRPAVSCAMIVVERTRAYRSHRNHPAFPAQWFYGLYRALPGARALWSPSPVELLPRTWRQRRGVRTTRLRRPQQMPSSEAFSASTASRPAFRDVAQRPSVGRDERNIGLIWLL